jgi:hypothetical protein
MALPSGASGVVVLDEATYHRRHSDISAIYATGFRCSCGPHCSLMIILFRTAYVDGPWLARVF